MKSNKRISAGKSRGNPAYRTAATWRAQVALKAKHQRPVRKNPLG